VGRREAGCDLVKSSIAAFEASEANAREGTPSNSSSISLRDVAWIPRYTDIMGDAPRVFLSHASEDKERFVLRFAAALRHNGVDVWLDKWEILPGDSLVDKLFEEGLKQASAVIIVISTYSVNKRWVKEELNAAIINRVTKQTKIIPVILDECEVPEALRSTVWEKIENLDDFSTPLQRIIQAIFGQRQKPALGPPPAYAAVDSQTIPGLTGVDVLVFRTIYEEAIVTNKPIVTVESIAAKLRQHQLTTDTLLDSVEIVAEHRYADAAFVLNGVPRGIFSVRPTHYGFLQYAKAFLPDFQNWLHATAMQIINHDQRRNVDLATTVQTPQFVMDQILKYFSERGWIKLTSQTLSGYMQVLSVSPSLRRQFGQ
jgi:TIR domain-containing protein